MEIGISVKNVRKRGGVGITESDIKSDYLVWVDFGDYFLGESDTIEVSILKNPGTSFLKKLAKSNCSYPRFRAISIVKGIVKEISLERFLSE
jgi:hypothetical protein